ARQVASVRSARPDERGPLLARIEIENDEEFPVVRRVPSQQREIVLPAVQPDEDDRGRQILLLDLGWPGVLQYAPGGVRRRCDVVPDRQGQPSAQSIVLPPAQQPRGRQLLERTGHRPPERLADPLG